MNQQNPKAEQVVFEEKAQELVSLTFALCERRVANEGKASLQPQKALEAAALSVQASVNTFLAVTNIPDEGV
jgi:hypothetical protein